ncbi:unnamed protein product [Phyllotreta striolata]|uniref:Beta-galactosidase n=1 Tax=Phyllotreta striolata TaxID=444603 RepID=A0A9P0GUQ6_PHYSR|nr:unnamed protein product [Phyllotreta striolata]
MSLTTDVLPTLYQHYTAGGIHSGLNADKPYFTLNDRNVTLYSGSLHYFRVPKAYWRDRLRKLRAAGLNAIETYIPWNLHEPQPGWYDFGDGGSDMQEFLDLREFLRTVKEEDLFAIVRPGPYICTEWEFGGFPSWLLRENDLKIRTSDESYMKHVRRYFNVLLPILALLQFTKGGPVVAFQVENEYGSTEQKGKFTPDRAYLRELRDLYTSNNIVELLVTSDGTSSHRDRGTLPGVFLQTSNFAGNPEREFDVLRELQPNRPVMAMEFWTGWFDHWSEVHHLRNDDDFKRITERILKYPASVNMYMFHGGTNFGFMNGANLKNGLVDNSGYQPDTTSYDYDAPLSENGDYTIKYVMVKELLKKYNNIPTRLPQTPSETPSIAYDASPITHQLILQEVLANQQPVLNKSVVPMELLPINNNTGQSYGYVVYRKRFSTIPANSVLRIGGRVCDTVVVLLNGKLMSKPLNNVDDLNGFGFWNVKNGDLSLGPENRPGAVLDLLVENWGRVNFGNVKQFAQFKGLWQDGVYLNNELIRDWEIYPLEFKRSWTGNLSGWRETGETLPTGAGLYKTRFFVNNTMDTYVDMSDWCKGIVIVNDFVLGRYSRIGPQQTLYLPAPLLKTGWNQVIIFEHYNPSKYVKFSDKPIFKTRNERHPIETPTSFYTQVLSN